MPTWLEPLSLFVPLSLSLLVVLSVPFLTLPPPPRLWLPLSLFLALVDKKKPSAWQRR